MRAAASNAKFPFAQNSRFKPKREKCLKGNLKPKTGIYAKREFNTNLKPKTGIYAKREFK